MSYRQSFLEAFAEEFEKEAALQWPGFKRVFTTPLGGLRQAFTAPTPKAKPRPKAKPKASSSSRARARGAASAPKARKSAKRKTQPKTQPQASVAPNEMTLEQHGPAPGLPWWVYGAGAATPLYVGYQMFGGNYDQPQPQQPMYPQPMYAGYY